MNNITDGKNRDHFPDKQIIRRTLVIMTMCGIVAFLVLIYKLYKIQILDHDYYESMAVSQQVSSSGEIAAPRGTIYDRNGNVLAVSTTSSNVFISPYELIEYGENKEAISSFLAAELNLDYNDIILKFSHTDSWYEMLKKQVDEKIIEEIKKYIDENGDGGLKSIHIESSVKRYYPYNSLACHVIGFVGTDYYGLEGIEAYYDTALSGKDGKTVKLKNAGGSELVSTDFSEYYDITDGYDVTLTIDTGIQKIVEENLEQAIELNDVQNGAACIVMDPNTCEILAMASYGNYNLNDYLSLSAESQARVDAIEDEEQRSNAETEELYLQWRNKALSDTYEPGSVFKSIVLAMALEEGLITEEDTFYCSGSIEVMGREPVNCWLHSGHGRQTLSEAVQNSCNCAFVTIGEKIGAEKFYEYVSAFGLFDYTDIDLNGENTSIWWSKEVFEDPTNKSQLAAASFGQTFAVTPIQMITAMSAVCNGGNLKKPYIVSSIVDAEGNAISLFKPETVRQVISEETSKVINSILESVVTFGGGKNAYVAGYHIAGKTGTSEKVKENLTAAEREYVVSFCGYAPSDDPKIIVLLLLDTPSHSTGRYISGANMAAPVVGNIIPDILDYLGYEIDYTEAESLLTDVLVPNLYGLSREEAIHQLEAVGLDYEIDENCTIIKSQIPAAWSYVASGSCIRLYSDAELYLGEVSVPNLVDMTYIEARKRLDNLGLYITKKSGIENNEVTVGIQYIAAGSTVKKGTVIEVALVDNSLRGEF